MKRIFSSLFTAILLIAPFSAIRAAAVPGDLIKASGPDVYYFGPDSKRYVFPNEKTYFTWYADFSGVRTISDVELATYPLGGNVTYRPGLKMLKIMTDPRVYAVDAHSTLRHVESESLAGDLYGADWNQRIDDISDAFFTNYTVGNPIRQPGDYDPAAVLAAATSIAVEKGLVTPEPPAPTPTPPPEPTPTPTSTHVGTLTASKLQAAVNEPIDVLAQATYASSIDRVRIYFDGGLEKECTYAPCGLSKTIPADKTSYVFLAEFFWITGERASSTVTITVEAGSQAGLSLFVSRPEVKPGSLIEIVASADSSFIAKTIDIFIDNNNVRGCTDIQECRYTGPADYPVNSTHTVFAVFRDTNGFSRTTAAKSFAVVENDHPYVTVTLGKTFMYRGETMDVTVQATDEDGIDHTEVWFGGSLVKSCASTVCTAIIGPVNTSGTYTVEGRAEDTTSLVGSGVSESFLVQ